MSPYRTGDYRSGNCSTGSARGGSYRGSTGSTRSGTQPTAPRSPYYARSAPKTSASSAAIRVPAKSGSTKRGGLSPNTLRRIIAAVCAAALIVTGLLTARATVRGFYPMKYDALISATCREFGLEPSLAYAVIKTESGFDEQALSNVGAMGLMQIMPETFEWLQKKLPPEEALPPEALYRPEVNIRYGVFYLSMLHGQFGDDTLTIAAYHAGQNRVSGWLGDGVVYAGCTADDVPSSATAHYVRKVSHAREVYLRLYEEELCALGETPQNAQ